MAARDDSTVRAISIISLTLLVFSLVGNALLYHSASTNSAEAEAAGEQLANSQNELRTRSDQIRLMKAMMGVGQLSEAEFDMLRTSASGDAEMEEIERQFLRDMAYLGPEVDSQNRNYPALPEYLVNAIRSRNTQVSQAREDVTQIRAQAASDVENARNAQANAERVRDEKIQELEKATEEFMADRARMKEEGEKTKDELNKVVREYQGFQQKVAQEKKEMEESMVALRGLVEDQRQELARLRSDRFENVQGDIAHVIPPGRLVLINLGSADALRVGVQFGVVDVDAINIEEAELKAKVQVTKILGDHVAQARVLGEPSFRNPLVQGDKLYSPFWAPGRQVKIALAGDIDITGDGHSDVDHLKSMIQMAGATVAATLSPAGEVTGQLDSSIRFLVVGEPPLMPFEDEESPERLRVATEIANFRQRARELGITTIPAWKLMEYLRALSDVITTPLGGDARAEDFPPESILGTSQRNRSTVLPELFRNQVEGQRQGQRRN